jgi:hypothetical protein
MIVFAPLKFDSIHIPLRFTYSEPHLCLLMLRIFRCQVHNPHNLRTLFSHCIVLVYSFFTHTDYVQL